MRYIRLITLLIAISVIGATPQGPGQGQGPGTGPTEASDTTDDTDSTATDTTDVRQLLLLNNH